MNAAGRAAIEAMPATVRVGGFDFKLEKWTHHQAAGASRYGEFSSIEQTIRLQLDMPSQFKAVDTLLHELSHAIYWVYGIHDEDKEERVVGVFGSGLMALHRDNPWLAGWISKALGS